MTRVPFFTDDYNRSDGPIGGNYTDSYATSNSATIEANSLRATATSVATADAVTAVSLPGDQYGQIRIEFITGPDHLRGGIMLRAAAPPTETWYEFLFGRNVPAGWTSRIVYRVAGVNTAEATDASITWQDDDLLRAESIGGMQTLYHVRGAVETAVLALPQGDLTSGLAGPQIFADTLSALFVDDLEIGGFSVPEVGGWYPSTTVHGSTVRGGLASGMTPKPRHVLSSPWLRRAA